MVGRWRNWMKLTHHMCHHRESHVLLDITWLCLRFFACCSLEAWLKTLQPEVKEVERGRRFSNWFYSLQLQLRTVWHFGWLVGCQLVRPWVVDGSSSFTCPKWDMAEDSYTFTSLRMPWDVAATMGHSNGIGSQLWPMYIKHYKTATPGDQSHWGQLRPQSLDVGSAKEKRETGQVAPPSYITYV